MKRNVGILIFDDAEVLDFVYEHMREIEPTGIPQPAKRFVNSGKLYTSGGISAGIDLSFHVVEQLHGNDTAKRTAEYMEYVRSESI